MFMVYRNIRQIVRDWQWIAAVLCIVLMLAPGGAWAGIQEIRVVAVGVDSSSVAAEEKAINYARKRAVYLASRKLGIKNVSKVVAKFSALQFNEIIRGANVVQSRRQGEVTYSEVNVTIVDEALRRALKLPTRIYVKSLLPILAQGHIKGLSHITGGGLTENLPRVLPAHLSANIDLSSWHLPNIFNWLREAGNIPEHEMLMTFNCGIGMIAVVGAQDVFMVREALEKSGETVHIIGELSESDEGTPRVTYSDSLCVA